MLAKVRVNHIIQELLDMLCHLISNQTLTWSECTFSAGLK